MRSLGNLLGSTARTELLRVLAYQSNPLGLRQAARLAKVLPRSADLALRGLVNDGLVLCRKTRARNDYLMNHDHPETKILIAVFDAEATARLQAKQCELNERAQRILPFIEEATAMLAHAKRSDS